MFVKEVLFLVKTQILQNYIIKNSLTNGVHMIISVNEIENLNISKSGCIDVGDSFSVKIGHGYIDVNDKWILVTLSW